MHNLILTRKAESTIELDADAIQAVSGGIWDYSNRLGYLGEHLEELKNLGRPDYFNPKNLDEAANQVNLGWVSL